VGRRQHGLERTRCHDLLRGASPGKAAAGGAARGDENRLYRERRLRAWADDDLHNLREAIGHEGDFPGYRNAVWATPNGRRVAVAMVNIDTTHVSWSRLEKAAQTALCSG